MSPPASDDVQPIHTRRSLLASGWTDGQILRARHNGLLSNVLAGTYLYNAAGPSTTSHLLESLRARYGSELVVVLGTAARLRGLPEPWPSDHLVHVRLPPGREIVHPPNVRVHTWQLDDDETTTLDGVRVTTVSRTLVDLMCTTDRLSAVSALDSALRQGSLDPEHLKELEASTRRRRGSARSRPWWREADGRAESPLETRVRLRAIDGGYPPHTLQMPFDIDARRYYVDFAWKRENGRLVVGEADGREFHDTPDAVLNDRHRSNDLVGRGDVDMVRFTWVDTTRPWPIPAALAPLLGPPRQ